jgi:hypothetical protein
MTTISKQGPVRFATHYLELETRSISSLERTFGRELAQATLAATRKKRKKGVNQPAPIRTS